MANLRIPELNSPTARWDKGVPVLERAGAGNAPGKAPRSHGMRPSGVALSSTQQLFVPGPITSTQGWGWRGPAVPLGIGAQGGRSQEKEPLPGIRGNSALVLSHPCPRLSPFCEELGGLAGDRDRPGWGQGTGLIYEGFCALGAGSHYLGNHWCEEIH